MIATENKTIVVSTLVNAPIERVWSLWTKPEHIVNWNYATDEWHSPTADNDLREGGHFSYRMEAKDGSMGFDFAGEYIRVSFPERIEYAVSDGRKVSIDFTTEDGATRVTERFEAEGEHAEDLQRAGWQAILDNFKRYAESGDRFVTLRFEVLVDAPVEKTYRTMLDADTYREWTTEFCHDSFYRGTWKKDEKMHFVGVNKEGKQEGMVSRVKENIPNEIVSLEHIGVLNGEEEILSGSAVDGWAGALETYRFEQADGKTIISVSMDANEQFRSYFEQTWPKALQKLKAICEQ